MSQLFTWGSQSTGVSASTSVLLLNIQDWSPLRWTGWISLQSKGLSRVLSHGCFIPMYDKIHYKKKKNKRMWNSSTTHKKKKSLVLYHSSKAAILQCSGSFTVQLSHSYMTTGKTIALTRRTFVGKAMSLLFIMLSRVAITFLPRSKGLLISWLQSPSALTLEPKK